VHYWEDLHRQGVMGHSETMAFKIRDMALARGASKSLFLWMENIVLLMCILSSIANQSFLFGKAKMPKQDMLNSSAEIIAQRRPRIFFNNGCEMLRSDRPKRRVISLCSQLTRLLNSRLEKRGLVNCSVPSYVKCYK
jgi:hypothetical protein